MSSLSSKKEKRELSSYVTNGNVIRTRDELLYTCDQIVSDVTGSTDGPTVSETKVVNVQVSRWGDAPVVTWESRGRTDSKQQKGRRMR